MLGILGFAYGLVAYAVFFATFLYAIAFVGNLPVPKSIDSGEAGPLLAAIGVNVLLLGVFAIQHSLMARPAFKRWWSRLVPPPIERSTYVLLSSFALIALFYFWRPMGGTLWKIENVIGHALLLAVFCGGWLTVLISTFLIDHFGLFGLRQVWTYLRGQQMPMGEFRTPGLYQHVRHPIMLGFVIAFWATPVMTQGHALFALATTIYILIAIQLEETDLLAIHGEKYAAYRNQVSMLIPGPGSSCDVTASQSDAAA